MIKLREPLQLVAGRLSFGCFFCSCRQKYLVAIHPSHKTHGAQDRGLMLFFSYTPQGEIDDKNKMASPLKKPPQSKKTSLSFLDNQITYLRNPEGQLQGILDNEKPSVRFEYDDQEEFLTS